jgi:nitrate/TMAO reductase-like tetraheme cytochrome c subunit
MSVSLKGLVMLVISSLPGMSQAEEAYQMPPMHHPVEITIPTSMQVPTELDLGPNDELVCETCHGIKDLKQIPLDEVDIEAPDFLNLGPYQDLTEFCYLCHEKEGHERYNIHLMLNEKGEIDDRGCIYCHTEPPDPSKTYEANELEFRLTREKLCYGCHLKTPHLNALNHQVEPSDEIKEVMRQAEKDHEVKLPLSDLGKVICITCHSPHQSGVIDPQTPAGNVVEEQPIEDGIAYRRTAWSTVFAKDKVQRLEDLTVKQELKADLPEYLRVEKEILLRLPAKDGTLCLSCHDFED